MGTSISQPSPSSPSEGGEAWTDLRKTLKTDALPEKAIEQVFQAYQAEYGDSAIALIADPGVQKIEALVTSLSPSAQKNEFLKVAEYTTRARRILAKEKCSSFLAELAISAGVSALLEKTPEARRETFVKNYVLKLVDYVVSRDLPSTIGSVGLPNPAFVQAFVSATEKSLSSLPNAKNGILALVKSVLSVEKP